MGFIRNLPLPWLSAFAVFTVSSLVSLKLGMEQSGRPRVNRGPAEASSKLTHTKLTGIVYSVQFGDWDSANSRGDTGFCHQTGWENGPVLFDGKPYCYSSQRADTALVHAREIEEIGIDFLVVPLLKESILKLPFENHEFVGLRALMQGLRRSSKLRVMPVIPLVCQGSTCPSPQPSGHETMIWNAVQESLLKEIFRLYDEDPSLFMTWEKKPLLGFYVGASEKIMTERSRDFNPSIVLKDNTFHLRDVFMPRFFLSVQGGDLTRLGVEAWPWRTQHSETKFKEVKLASPYFAGDNVNSSSDVLRKSMQTTDEPIVLIQAWNNHSDDSTDKQTSIEPTLFSRELYDTLKK